VNRTRLLLVLVYAAFVSLGLPDGALGVAWPAMRADLGQPLEALGIVTLLWLASSALSGFAAGAVLARLGTPKVVVLSGLLTGLALLGFAFAPSFLGVTLLAVPFGLGAGAVDAGLNHFAAEHYSSRHMNWLHASWGLGATLGPLAIAASVANGDGWRRGYLGIAVAQLLLVAVLVSARRLWDQVPARAGPARPESGPGRPVSRSALILAPLTYALYVGAEGGIGFWAASVLRDGRGFEPGLAGAITGAFYAAIALGRLVSGAVAERVGNRRMVRVGLALALLGLGLFSLQLGPLAASAGLALTGLGFAPIYPCLMHETPRRFDAVTTRRVVGHQVACACLGAMLLPPVFGLAAARMGLSVVAPSVALLVLLLAIGIVALDARTPA